MNLPTVSAPAPAGHPTHRRRIAGIGISLLVLAAATYVFRPRAPLLPIPVPANIGSLDPQVRAHLANIAERIAEAPRDAERRADMGLALAVNGLWAEARQCFTNALQLGSPKALPALYAAVALQELGDYSGAIRELRDLVHESPQFAPAWDRLGRALLAAGQHGEAIEAFRTVTRLAPDDWHGWAGLGEALVRSDEGSAAIDPLAKARQLAPTTRSIRHLLGLAYQGAGKTAEAQVELAAGGSQSVGPMPDPWSERALEHMKSLPDQFDRTDALLANGQVKEAIARLGQALRYHPTNAAVIASLARALNIGEQTPSAWRLLTNALAATPNDVSLLVVAVDTAATLSLTNEAVQLAGRALALAPQSAEAHVARANAMLVSGRDTDAVTSLKCALDLNPRQAGLWVQLGDVQRLNLHDAEAAAGAYRQGHQIDPIDPGPLVALITLLIEQGHLREAEANLGDLRQLGPGPSVLAELEKRLRTASRPR